jgi:hypothetical protein
MDGSGARLDGANHEPAQHRDTLTRHLKEFENLSEQWSAERRGLDQQSVHLLLKLKQLEEDSDRNSVLLRQERQAGSLM